MWMVKNPEWFDVIVTGNMFGDIITDLGAMTQGGMGIAAGGNINPKGVSMFEPIGGSAPKYTGKNVINPLAAICAGAMMLEHLGEEKAAPLDRGRRQGRDRHQAQEHGRRQDGLLDDARSATWSRTRSPELRARGAAATAGRLWDAHASASVATRPAAPTSAPTGSDQGRYAKRTLCSPDARRTARKSPLARSSVAGRASTSARQLAS